MLKQRGSGMLLHFTSLPSPFGIGDFGPWAYRFADFLAQTKQSYWQCLPLNPTEVVYGNSPYHSNSAFGFNPLLLSPELLIQEGALTEADLKPIPSLSKDRYWLGERALLQLRDAERERRGAGFSLRAFHDSVLAHGSLPVPLVARLMAQRTASAPAEGTA